MAAAGGGLKSGRDCWADPVALDRLLSSQEYVILNCDDHRNFLLKHHKDPADYRPDILHQARPPLPSCSRPGSLRTTPSFAGSAHDIR